MFISEQYIMKNLLESCDELCLDSLLLQIEEMDISQKDKLILVDELESVLNESLKYSLGALALGGIVIAVKIIQNINKEYKLKLKANCSKFKGSQFNLCRAKTANYMVSQLKSNLKRCDKAKNPEKCKSRINKSILKFQRIVANNS